MVSEKYKLERCVVGYEKDPGDALCVEYLLPQYVDVEMLREIFPENDEDEDPEFYYSYPLQEEHVKKLQPFVKEKIDLNEYDFFLHCYSVK